LSGLPVLFTLFSIFGLEKVYEFFVIIA